MRDGVSQARDCLLHGSGGGAWTRRLLLFNYPGLIAALNLE